MVAIHTVRLALHMAARMPEYAALARHAPLLKHVTLASRTRFVPKAERDPQSDLRVHSIEASIGTARTDEARSGGFDHDGTNDSGRSP